MWIRTNDANDANDARLVRSHSAQLVPHLFAPPQRTRNRNSQPMSGATTTTTATATATANSQSNPHNPAAQQPIPPNVITLRQSAQLEALYTIIRDRNTTRGDFIFYSDRIIRLLVRARPPPAGSPAPRPLCFPSPLDCSPRRAGSCSLACCGC